MELLVSLLFHFFVSSLMIFKTGEGSMSYGSMIKKVSDEYQTFGIIVATTNHPSFEKMTTLQTISREISTRGIGSVAVKFRQLKETVKFHHKQSARPLVVIYIDKITEILDFKKETVDMDMSYPIWLVLFTGDGHGDSCGYCRHPIGNPFNTEVLVSCCNSSSLVKWSSKNTNYSSTLYRNEMIEKGNGSEGYPNGTLNSNQQFLVNKELRIVIWAESHYVWKKDNELHGYLGDIVTQLSRVMNFTISNVCEEENFGSLHPNKSMCTGVVGLIAQGKADIGIAEVAMTSQRLDIVDISLTLMRSKYVLYIAQSEHVSIQWNGFFKVYHLKVWIAIVMLMSTTPLLLTIIEYKKNNNLFDMICMHYLNVWGLFCQHSWSGSLRRKPSRIVFLSVFILTLVINAGYSAGIVRFLTIAPSYLPFRTAQEFVNDGTYKVIALRHTAEEEWIETNNHPLLKKMRTLMKPRDSLPTTLEESFKQVS